MEKYRNFEFFSIGHYLWKTIKALRKYYYQSFLNLFQTLHIFCRMLELKLWELEVQSSKSDFEKIKWYGIQICKTGNPPTFCSNWPIESCQDQTNKQAH